MSEETLFAEALALSDPAARAAFLEQACGGDDALRQRIEALLRSHEQAGSFLDKPAADAGATSDVAPGQWLDPNQLPQTPLEGVGSRIGPYKLLQQIGEGGMGMVYMAEQQEPVRRKVALKIIKPGMDSTQVIARFEAERQALALMDHQNIARVLDAGTTASGRPYFVMELVKGVPITRFCDDNHLTPRERLELFVPVCQAIQHAHQKGIIHRDIKPSNVLVTLYDGKPVPKVIDFGVAKAIEQRLTERTLFTQIGQVVGTLEYMAPEQAEINALDIDTRSDIYSLGVLLYELLTGSTPLEKQKLRSAVFTEMLRMIREEEPPKPSTRLSASRDQLATISAHRKTEPAKLTKLVRGELDWIVMKALEKDRGRRYETANGFARDIQRYLVDEPVEACPPSAGYKLRKFARKNRKPLAMAGAFALLLAGSAVVSTWQAIRATRAEEKARQAQTLAEEQFNLAKEAVDKYLNEVTEDPELKGANFETLRKKLLETAVLFYQKLAEQAPGDAERESAIGQAYLRLASIRGELGQGTAATQDSRQAREIFARLADGHPDVPDYRSRLVEIRISLAQLNDEAELRTAIKDAQRLADEHPNNPDYRQLLSASHASLANLLGWRQANHVEAESEYRIAIEGFQRLADEHPNIPTYRFQVAKSHHELADALSGQNKGAEAEGEYRAAIQEHQRLADEHPKVPLYRFELAMNRHALANHLVVLSKSSEAEARYRAALKDHQRLADEHPKVPQYRHWLAVCHHRLGTVLDNLGKQTDAEAEFRIAIKQHQSLVQDYPADGEFRRLLVEDHYRLGRLLASLSKRTEAEGEFRAALKVRQRWADQHPKAPNNALTLADSHIELGNLLMSVLDKPAEAKNEYLAAIKFYQRPLDEHPNNPASRGFLVNSHNNLGWLLATCSHLKLRDPKQAVAHAQKAVELAPSDGTIWNTLGVALYRNGDWNAAIEVLLKSAQLRKGGDSFDWFFLAMAHWKLNEKEKARTWYDRAVAWMDKNHPQNEELKRFRVEATALLGLAKTTETPKRPATK